ncbi:hypothetical protein QJQ58_21160 [Paenibacillus dendritiformis]|uniref:tubby C-terminal domain-like protein n=1 Tax=Paenibacillus dendritiformis TaxID=130049 RepID=UPI00248CE3BA|nr:hypothetical protein [Paenibacillus dendritiformis]WGU93054.1 hypothetical protein QJQ58_21160 [Paenibacillus dendritiformis]
MERYYYTCPLLKMSTAPIAIEDEGGNAVGSFHRIFTTRTNKAVSWVVDNWQLSLEGRHIHSELHVKIMDSSPWLGRRKWTITTMREGRESLSFLKDRSKIATHPRLIWRNEEHEYVIAKDPLNRTATISDSCSHAIVGEIAKVPGGKLNQRELVIYENALCPLVLPCIDRIMRTLY